MTKKSPCKKKPLPLLATKSDCFGFCHAADTVVFRVLAPHADSVSVCGDFNAWDPHRHPMQRISEDGIWELKLPEAIPEHSKYKYFLRRGERGFFKADPFGRQTEKNSNGATVAIRSKAFSWRDDGWMGYRRGFFSRDAVKERAVHAYRVDPLWWRRHDDGSVYNYRELAGELIPYVKQMGYTHVELLGVTGGFSKENGVPDALYAPMPLMGSPEELKFLIDSMHEAGVGVIFEWNPFFFAASEHGLSDFDGERLYEAEGESGDIRAFDLDDPTVRAWLLENALYWIGEYHADGLSVATEKDPSFLSEWRALVNGRFPDVMTLSGAERKIRTTLMGDEFGDAWQERGERPLAWELLDQHMHAERQLFTARENHSYLSRSQDVGTC